MNNRKPCTSRNTAVLTMLIEAHPGCIKIREIYEALGVSIHEVHASLDFLMRNKMAIRVDSAMYCYSPLREATPSKVDTKTVGPPPGWVALAPGLWVRESTGEKV